MRQRDELELLQGRISILGYAIVVALVVLTAGFWHFQIAQSSYYRDLAEKNRIKQIPLIAPRGQIKDREGRILVDNRPSNDVILIRENDQRHTVEQTAAMLAPGLGMTVDELLAILERHRKEPRFRPVVLKEDVTVADIAFVRAHQLEMDQRGVSVEFQPRRKYLEGELAAHAIGYLGEITEEELQRSDFRLYRPGDKVGRAGIERTYNSILRGKDGYRRVVVDKSQREVGKLGGEEAVPGRDLWTTLDLDLQLAAEDAIADRVGAAIAIDPRTGEILVLASRPAFDPNLFATRISVADWNTLSADPRKPLRNRAIQDRYPPGSIFKIFMAAAGLEAGTLNPLEHTYCNGSATIYGHTFACWKSGGHGTVGLYEAIVNSCNVFFYNVGKNLGIDKIARYTRTMGLGRKTGIDLPGEDSGLIPSREWKQGAYKKAADQKWYDGETISVSIGQGYVAITPIQAALAMGGLVTGGRLTQPHLVKPETLNKVGFKGPELRTEEYPVSPATVDVVTRAMWGVVNEAPGTGTRAAVEGFDVAGKTGTAQVVSRQSYRNNSEFEDNAWFVGFAPYRNPEIVVAVFIEHGGHGGSEAAPVAHAILDTYYKKKMGRFTSGPKAPIADLKR